MGLKYFHTLHNTSMRTGYIYSLDMDPEEALPQSMWQQAGATVHPLAPTVVWDVFSAPPSALLAVLGSSSLACEG